MHFDEFNDADGPANVATVTTRREPGGLGFHGIRAGKKCAGGMKPRPKKGAGKKHKGKRKR